MLEKSKLLLFEMPYSVRVIAYDLTETEFQKALEFQAIANLTQPCVSYNPRVRKAVENLRVYLRKIDKLIDVTEGMRIDWGEGVPKDENKFEYWEKRLGIK